MENIVNTAGRLLSIYDKLLRNGRGNEAARVEVWAKVCGLSTDKPSMEDDVVICFQAMRSEMDLLRSKLAEIGAPEELMQSGINRLRNKAACLPPY